MEHGDYAADTCGYTYGLVTEYIDKNWSARYDLALMPPVANGIDLDWNLRRASGQNWEFELRRPLLAPVFCSTTANSTTPARTSWRVITTSTPGAASLRSRSAIHHTPRLQPRSGSSPLRIREDARRFLGCAVYFEGDSVFLLRSWRLCPRPTLRQFPERLHLASAATRIDRAPTLSLSALQCDHSLARQHPTP
jgi:hypothetical protein